MDKKEWLIEVKIKSYNGARQWKEWTINEAKRFTNDEKWSEYTSRWRKMTWKDVRMTDGRANRRIKRGRTDLQVSTIIYDWSAITLKSAVLCRERDHAHACHLAEKARNKDGCARCWQKAKIYAKLTHKSWFSSKQRLISGWILFFEIIWLVLPASISL